MVRKSGKRSHSAVLLEEIKSDVAKVAEGHGTLVRGQQEIRAEIAELRQRMGLFEKALIEGLRDIRTSIAEHTHA
jgi:hypothetical protein